MNNASVSNVPSTSPPTVSPKTSISLREARETLSRQLSLSPQIAATIAQAANNLHQAGALLMLFIPEHPAAIVTSKNIAEIPSMNWLVVGFPASKVNEDGSIFLLLDEDTNEQP